MQFENEHDLYLGMVFDMAVFEKMLLAPGVILLMISTN
jgi:hypothetical protein